MGNVHLIGMCESQGLVVCSSLYSFSTRNIIIIIINIFIIILIPFHTTVPSSFSGSLTLHLDTLCLVFLHAVTDGALQCVFHHPLDMFSPVTLINSKFIQTST